MRARVILPVLALAAVAAIAAAVFPRLGPRKVEFEATDISGVSWGRDFRLTGDDGAPHGLADFRGKVAALYGDTAATARTVTEFKVEAGEHHSIPVFLFDTTGRLRLVAHPEASAESIARDMRLLLRAG